MTLSSPESTYSYAESEKVPSTMQLAIQHASKAMIPGPALSVTGTSTRATCIPAAVHV